LTDLTARVGGVRISHPARVIYPAEQITKSDLAGYYAAIAPWVVPHVAGRPLTLVHCPQGLAGKCAYMRHTKAWGPSALRRVRIREKTKIGEYLVADDIVGVVSLVQMGMVEIHTWNATADDIERPNRIVWDLDPGPEVPWSKVVAAARQVRGVLAAMDLACWVKTTGGRGLHVVAPIRPERDWSECLTFSRQVAEMLTRADPGRYTTAFAKRGRERLILIDYLRNNRTNTSIAAYASRARSGAAVSMPMSWKRLTGRLDPQDFTVLSVPTRLRRVRADPWQDYWRCRQRLTLAILRAVRQT
jgi:bifunctional non-homologous end joining protein LigD